MTPLARTMARLNASGWTGEIVERRLCSKAMHDPFGLDVIALMFSLAVWSVLIGLIVILT